MPQKNEQCYIHVFVLDCTLGMISVLAAMLTALLADFHPVQSLLWSTNDHNPKKIITFPDMQASLNL